MFSRIRAAFAIALLVAFATTLTAFAKGGFTFISITGPGLKEAVRVTDTALTSNFFSFANFAEDKTQTPVDPGPGYEITRGYVDGAREIIFDRLHYYPEAGFVFYDGIENGESEYDGEWYTANPEIKAVFESALGIQTGSAPPVEKKEPVISASQAGNPNVQPQPVPDRLPSLPVVVAVSAIGLAVLFVLAFWRRKASV